MSFPHTSQENMSETQLKKLKAEKERLENEADFVTGIIRVSDACAEYVSFLKVKPLFMPPVW